MNKLPTQCYVLRCKWVHPEVSESSEKFMRNYARPAASVNLFITNHTTNTKVFTIESRNHLFITSITNQTKRLNPNKPKEQTEQQHTQTQLFPNENDILLHYNLDSSSSSTSIHNVTAKRFSYAMSSDYDETVYYTYTPNSCIYNIWMDTHSFITISPNGCQRNLLLVHDYLYL